MKRPQVRIINHLTRDAGTEREGSSELNLPWEKRQVINDALSNIKRAANAVPASVTTSNQVDAVKRALGALRVEVDTVMRLLLEKSR